MNYIKSLILVLITFLTVSAKADPVINFNPDLMAGVGYQFGGKSPAFYIFGKSYLIEVPKHDDFDILGLGLSINTNGLIELLASPVSWSFYENWSVAPDVGLGLNKTRDTVYGVSVSFMF